MNFSINGGDNDVGKTLFIGGWLNGWRSGAGALQHGVLK